MKSAEERMKEFIQINQIYQRKGTPTTKQEQNNHIKRLNELFNSWALDAMKEGARRMANICMKTKTGQREDSRVACHDNILSAAEQLTEKDLCK